MTLQILNQIEEIIKSCILSKRSIERKEQFAKSGIDANNSLYDLLWKYIQEKNPKKCMRFSSFPKEFSNPNTSYETPAGLYAYNLKYAIDTYFIDYDDWFNMMKHDKQDNFSHIDYINEFLDHLPFATNPFHYKYVIFFDIKEDTKIADPTTFKDNGEYEKLVEAFYSFVKLSLEKKRATGQFFEDTYYGKEFNKSLNYVNGLSLEDKEELYNTQNHINWASYIKNTGDIYKKLNNDMKTLKTSRDDISDLKIDKKYKITTLDIYDDIINEINKFLDIKITNNKILTEKNIIEKLSRSYNKNENCIQILSNFVIYVSNLIDDNLYDYIKHTITYLKDSESNDLLYIYELKKIYTTLHHNILDNLKILKDKMLEIIEVNITSTDFFNNAILLFDKDKNLFEKEIKKNINDLFYNILNKNDYISDKMSDKNNKELARVWYLCGHFANSRNPGKSIAARFKTMLEQVCGIEAIIDSGTGLIHPSEMSQVWIANSTYIDNVEIVKNINGFDNRLKDKQKISFPILFHNQFKHDKFFSVTSLESSNGIYIFEVIKKSNKGEINIEFYINVNEYDQLHNLIITIKYNNDQIIEFKYIITQDTVNQLFKNPNFKFKLNSDNFKRFINNSLYEIDNNKDANVHSVIINNVKKIFGPIDL